MKRYIVGLAVAIAAIGTTAFSVSASAAPKADTILIGISAAKTGILAPYDLQAGQLFQLRIDQLNKAGGVLGKQMKVKWIDTKSDKPTAATNASELISQGAVAILTTCDFDFSFPATQAAGAKKVLGLSLCASSPKAEIRPFRSCSPMSSIAWLSFHTCSAHCCLAYLALLLTGYLRCAWPRAKAGTCTGRPAVSGQIACTMAVISTGVGVQRHSRSSRRRANWRRKPSGSCSPVPSAGG